MDSRRGGLGRDKKDGMDERKVGRRRRMVWTGLEESRGTSRRWYVQEENKVGE